MRVRPSDELTDVEFHIGVCRQCSRYGQLDKTTRKCAVTDPPKATVIMGITIGGLTEKQEHEWFKRIRYCRRVGAKRGRETSS